MRVAVVGAGAAGLTAARALCEVGIRPVVYEASDRIGGLWVYRPPGNGPAYRSLRTNTSREITAFSDFPFAAGLPYFPPRSAVEAYLEGYADAFDLRSLIRFGCSVRGVEPATAGGWRLTSVDRGRESIEAFDAVIVCSGIFRQPLIPEVPGLGGFPGQVLHSIDYRVPEPFAGRHVLVVGIGSSAADIAVDLLGTAGRVTLSTRRGAWVAPRIIGGRPLDHRGSRLNLMLPGRVRTWRRQRLLLQEYARRGIEPPAQIWPQAGVPFDPGTALSVTSDDLLPAISSGALGARPGIERVEAKEVVFMNGERLRPDAIILCTGYGLDFSLLPPRLQPWTGPDSGLYRLVFPADAPGLAFIGVCRVRGPILPIVEMQARWAARVLIGEAALPSPAAMRAEAARRLRTQLARRDSPIRVPLIPYLDEIGALIGVRPHLARHPDLLRPLLTGPPVAAQYRLEGPGCWPGAAAVIRAAVDLLT